jgi:hypothetical protein
VEDIKKNVDCPVKYGSLDAFKDYCSNSERCMTGVTFKGVKNTLLIYFVYILADPIPEP